MEWIGWTFNLIGVGRGLWVLNWGGLDWNGMEWIGIEWNAMEFHSCVRWCMHSHDT